jgi:hypothetical protein
MSQRSTHASAARSASAAVIPIWIVGVFEKLLHATETIGAGQLQRA